MKGNRKWETFQERMQEEKEKKKIKRKIKKLDFLSFKDFGGEKSQCNWKVLKFKGLFNWDVHEQFHNPENKFFPMDSEHHATILLWVKILFISK